MKKILLLCAVLLILVSTETEAQFESPYLVTPELNIDYVDSCAQFWFNAWDDAHGGFYSDVNRQGNVTGNTKYMLTQSRNAYGMVRAYMMTGNEDYLLQARDALDWMIAHAWDNTNGGWYSELSETGNPVGQTRARSAFDQHYALLGIAAYVEATRDTTMLAKLLEGYQHIEDIYWDSREGYEGYYDLANYNGGNPRNKSFNATVDAVTTHLLLLQLMTEDDQYFARLEQLADNMIDHLVASMEDQAIGFVEHYDSDWNWNNNETMTIMGHVLKTSWCLGRIYRINNQERFRLAAHELFSDVWNNGYDHELGGPYKDYNRINGQMLMWGNPDTTKAWWQMEQGITAGLMINDLMYGIDPDINGRPYQMADETSAFFMEHFVDHQYGEVYENRTRYGDETWGTTKGNGYKAAYHSIETGYYSYLYANLYGHGDLTPLYYKIEPANEDRSFRMIPLAVDLDNLWIESVTLDGEDYTDFDSATNTLSVAANVGGTFVVSYGYTYLEAAEITEISLLPYDISIESVYPNPFNSTANLSFNLYKPGDVNVLVYNINGQLVNQYKQNYLNSGQHIVPLKLNNQASGSYIVTVETSSDKQSTRILLLK